MDARPYAPADREGCLAVFGSNETDPGECAAFAAYLDSGPENYFVLEHDSQVVACGGYELPASGGSNARLVWGMVGRQWQGQGLGRFLLLYRLRQMSRQSDAIQTVSVEAKPNEVPFFTAQGFRSVNPAGGRIEMIRKTAVCP